MHVLNSSVHFASMVDYLRYRTFGHYKKLNVTVA